MSGPFTIPPNPEPNAPGTQFTPPDPPTPIKPKSVVIPLLHEAGNQIALSGKGVGLGLIKPKFYKVDAARVANEQSADDGQGLLGLPVYDVLVINPFTWTDNDNKVIDVQATVFQQVLLEIHQPKNIVITVIQGRDKSVKEFINNGDYNVTINAKLVGKDANVPPIDQIKQLIKIKDAKVEIPVSSNILNYFGIYSLVIMESTFKQVEGTRNVMDVTLNCLDEVPFEIKTNA